LTDTLTKKVVMIVDDSAYNRRTFKKILEQEFDAIEVITARDGEEGLRLLENNNPDVITLDLEMPRMDGFTFLRFVMSQKPRPVIVVSAKQDEKSLLKALELGALDYISKPTQHASERLNEIASEYIEKIRLALSLEAHTVERRAKIMALQARSLLKNTPKIERSFSEVTRLVLIGASTGGPAAVQTVLSQLTPRRNVAICVVQHMPVEYTKAFAARLDNALPFEVKEVSTVEQVTGNTVFVAKGGKNMVITQQNDSVMLASVRARSTCKFVPSVDELFQSAYENFRRKMVGVVLTGMGNDGAKGAQRLRQRNLPVLVESEKTAIVYGMPKAVVDAGSASSILSLDEIGSEINKLLDEI
jgi:two-component system chemotaxis response regulator CheB